MYDVMRVLVDSVMYLAKPVCFATLFIYEIDVIYFFIFTNRFLSFLSF